ncbi:Na+/H+ antiporter subunit E [Pseudonocardia spirodelae]|uniref:Na+/H+ antiporter subunit E n=1 Tax=Pseudonocardia spirodelae TaxID=3133431 RepID=A0ABU8T5J8_9PSEU
MTTRRRAPGRGGRPRAAAGFLVWFTGEFFRANAVVLREVLTPGHAIDPAVVRVRLRSRSAVELATIMSLLSLTPGTLALDLTTGSRSPVLTVHGMHASDPEQLRASVHEMEDRLLAFLRRPTPGVVDRDPGTDAPVETT